jgi:cell division septal protein FtsQ
MNFSFLQRKRPRQKENTRFRNRDRDSRLAVKVPMSRKELRQRRKARTVSAIRWGAIGVSLAALLVYARSVWKQSFRNNAEFAVGRFEYRTNGGIPATQAAAAAGLRGDMNLMEVDLSSVRSRLMALPRVKEVHVTRRLPDHFSINIEERLPVAWITSVSSDRQGEGVNIHRERRLFLDKDGVAFKCEEHLSGYMSLPVINAVDERVITMGREITSPAVKAALSLLEQVSARTWPVPCSVNTIDIPNAWTLTASMDSGAVYTFNPARLEPQLDRLQFILSTAHSARRNVATVNLQMQRNVPVTFFPQLSAVQEPERAPGTAVPLAQPQNVSYNPSSQSRAKGTTEPPRPARPAARARQERDIQTILRGK